MTKKEERKIRVPESQYRAGRRALRRQEKAKRLIYELWLLFCNTKSKK